MLGFFIDDNAEDRTRISRLLSQHGMMIDDQFEPVEPMKLRDALLEKAPCIVALDFRLDDENLEENNYKAGALAQILRESLLERPELDFPIILVSTEENIKRIFSIDKTSHDLFDQKYMKGRLSDRGYRAECHRQMRGLAKGYKDIAACLLGQGGAASLLALSVDEFETMPLHGFAIDVLNADSVTHVVARLVLRQLIERPGPLLSPRDISARLGIENEPNQVSAAVEKLVALGMGYSGVFSDGWTRLWRHRLEAWADREIGSPLTSIKGADRAKVISKALGLDLKPAVSKWSNSSDELFAFACTVCGSPSERRNSLSLYDKYLLPYAEKKRVCFDCYVRGELDRSPHLAIDQSDLEIAADVVAGRIAR
ncbi:hypothetical protein [Pseudogemmobacter bohemicus]|uniref:hypothetical protein n=1 Tax=Pseudogemmobacter bohemicus TaxID=2250708 RepID=UPI000DD403F0|nr:hypothetical protein [Pseudogemmobacter bohemicus]